MLLSHDPCSIASHCFLYLRLRPRSQILDDNRDEDDGLDECMSMLVSSELLVIELFLIGILTCDGEMIRDHVRSIIVLVSAVSIDLKPRI
jgi:hypothetical protein